MRQFVTDRAIHAIATAAIRWRALIALAAAISALLIATAFSIPQASAKEQAFRIVVFGDSLTAGFQLPDEAGFASILQQALRARGYNAEVINASVSGDTTSGGLARIDWALKDKADAVIVELGANDMMRGVDPAKIYAALDQIVKRIKAKGAAVLLAGMIAGPGMGQDFEKAFNGIYPALSKTHEIALYPFFLHGIAGDKALNLPDGLHPNAAGVKVTVRNILPYVEKLIVAAIARR